MTGRGNRISLGDQQALSVAKPPGRAAELAKPQLERLGGTPLHTQGICNGTPMEPHLSPASLLNRLRRDAVQLLLALKAKPKAYSLPGLQVETPGSWSTGVEAPIPASERIRGHSWAIAVAACPRA
jgi:putative protease